MTDDTDSLLFWIEQEPVDSKTAEVIFLPPDTPTGQPSQRLQYQRNRIKELQRIRATERLRILHLENLVDFRKKSVAETVKDQLPNQHKDYLEWVKSDTYLEENLQDILKLVEDIDKNKSDKSLVEALHIKNNNTNEEERHELLKKQHVKTRYAELIGEEYKSHTAHLTDRFTKLLSLINPTLFQQIEADKLATSSLSPPPHGTRND